MLMLLATAGSEVAAEPAESWLQRYFDVHERWEVWWLLLGLLGQGVFFGRWLVQWIASERRGESHVPVLFWWCSIAGAGMLLLYFIGRREPVGILGQILGWTIYGRNLYLIYRRPRKIIEAGDPPEPLPGGSDEVTR